MSARTGGVAVVGLSASADSTTVLLMTTYLQDFRILNIGDWVDLYTKFQGQTDAQLAAGTAANYVGRRKVVRIEAENFVKVVSDPKVQKSPSGWQDVALGHHQIGADNISRRR
jgi:hypothetical protein